MQMSKFKVVLLLVVLFFPILIQSQKITYEEILKKDIVRKANSLETDVNFKKAQSFYLKKNWDSTLVYSMKCLNSRPKNELTDYCHLFRGVGFRELNLFKEAKKELLLVSTNFPNYDFIYISLGSVCLELGEFDKAIFFYQKADSYSKKDPNNSDINIVYENLGVCYLHLKQFDKAENYFFKFKEIKEKEKDTINLFKVYTNIANLYYEQYKDLQAIPYFEKAYTLSQKVKDFNIKRKAALNMAAVEENRDNFKQALVYRKEFEKWKDSINDQNKIWAVADFEKKFAVAQKQKQIKVLEVESELKESQRNWLFFSAISMFLLLTAGVYFYAQKIKNAKIILLQKNKLDELNATKDQLFSIVSHDLRSSVNALKTSNAKLSATLETKNYDELNQLIIQNSGIANGAYSLLDNLLHWALLQTKQLYFQKESVHLFSIIQQIEYNYKPLLLDKSIIFENSVSKNIFIFVDLDSLKIMLRNLLDNAIKFSNENGKISFYTQENNPDFCQLVLEDTGLGMDEETIAVLLKDDELLAKKGKSEAIGTGLGMQLCKQMIKKNDGTIRIESELHKGTKMILTFPKTEQNG